MNSSRPYRGVDGQTRTANRRSQLLEACLDVVAEAGVAAVSAEAICAAAGLSKRYFYESFKDRDEILVAALDRVFAPLNERLIAELSAIPTPGERIAVTAQTLVETFTADRRAAVLLTSSGANPALEARRRQVVDEFTPVLVREILSADLDDARARAVTAYTVAGTTEVLDRWLRGDLALDEPQFIELVAELGQRLAG